MQELLAAADILITDYSSCVWDYAFLNRPCFLYVPDREEYTEKTGFYVGLEQWPFAQAVTMEQLLTAIEDYEPEQAAAQRQAHLAALGSYEQGDCCQQLARRIMTCCFGDSGRKAERNQENV
jgi:CDP-glycerol glycerophosphotransferase